MYQETKKLLDEDLEFYRVFGNDIEAEEKLKIKCPICGNSKVINIPSSTLPIDEKTKTYIGTDKKVPKKVMKKHLSIKHICDQCLYEW